MPVFATVFPTGLELVVSLASCCTPHVHVKSPWATLEGRCWELVAVEGRRRYCRTCVVSGCKSHVRGLHSAFLNIVLEKVIKVVVVVESEVSLKLAFRLKERK